VIEPAIIDSEQESGEPELAILVQLSAGDRRLVLLDPAPAEIQTAENLGMDAGVHP
jgi:hypothetical protein